METNAAEEAQHKMRGIEGRSPIQRFKILWNIYRLSFAAYWQVRAARKKFSQDSEGLRLAINRIVKTWSSSIFNVMETEIRVQGPPISSVPTLFVSNHLSYIDIPLWFSLAPAALVAKNSIRYWPVFGPGAEGIGCVFVQRDSKNSREETTRKIGEALVKDKKNIVVFPEGTSSLYDRPWKYGSFRVAQQYKIPVQAARLFYHPIRECAYQGNDTFISSLWNLVGFPKVRIDVEVREPMMIEDYERDSKILHDWCRASFDNKLVEHGWNPEEYKIPKDNT